MQQIMMRLSGKQQRSTGKRWRLAWQAWERWGGWQEEGPSCTGHADWVVPCKLLLLTAVARDSALRELLHRRPPAEPAHPPAAAQQVGALRELVIHQDIMGLALTEESLGRLGAPADGGGNGGGLRRLRVCVLAQDEWFENSLEVGVKLQSFAALEDLRLTAYDLAFNPAVRLPPSLTALALGREVVERQEPGVALPLLLRRLGAGQRCQRVQPHATD